MIGNGCNITRAVQYPDNDHGIRERLVIDGIWAVEGYAEARSNLIPWSTSKREYPQRLERRFDCMNEARRDRLGCFRGDVEPDFGQISLGGFGQTDGERAANSFFPLSMMRSALKSFTRPSARSVKP